MTEYSRWVRSPLTPEQLTPLSAECELVELATPVTSRDLRSLAAFMADYPLVRLHVSGADTVTDLEFLRDFPWLSGFTAEVITLESFEGLRHLTGDLEFLSLGAARSGKPSLAPLEGLTGLREVRLEGHERDFDRVGALSRLERITLRSYTLADLESLTGLDALWSFDMKLGGTTNLAALPRIGRLKYLELWMIRGLSDLSVLSELTDLQYLFLQALVNVKTLPSFAPLARLRRVQLYTMKGLADLTPICEAPALDELVAVGMQQLQPAAFQCFVGHPTLRAASAGLGSDRKNRAVASLLPLAVPASGFEFS
jgi:hypothetical protein